MALTGVLRPRVSLPDDEVVGAHTGSSSRPMRTRPPPRATSSAAMRRKLSTAASRFSGVISGYSRDRR